MTRTDLAWAYSELNKYVQFPGNNHKLAAEHVAIFAALGIRQFATLVILTKTPTFGGVGQMQIELAILTTADPKRDIFS